MRKQEFLRAEADELNTRLRVTQAVGYEMGRSQLMQIIDGFKRVIAGYDRLVTELAPSKPIQGRILSVKTVKEQEDDDQGTSDPPSDPRCDPPAEAGPAQQEGDGGSQDEG